jgi:hypothetical protein
MAASALRTSCCGASSRQTHVHVPAGFEPNLSKPPGAWRTHIWNRGALSRRTIACASPAAALALLDAERTRSGALAPPVYVPDTRTLLFAASGESADIAQPARQAPEALAAAAREGLARMRDALRRRFPHHARPVRPVGVPAGACFTTAVEQVRSCAFLRCCMGSPGIEASPDAHMLPTLFLICSAI